MDPQTWVANTSVRSTLFVLNIDWEPPKDWGEDEKISNLTCEKYPIFTGVINLPILGGSKQYKCMGFLEIFPIIVHCLGW